MLNIVSCADLVQKSCVEDDYKIAATTEERAGAFRLVYRAYLEGGLTEKNPFQMRVTPFHLLSTTEVFVARCRGEVIFTMSLFMDSEMGLPMESVYSKEVVLHRQRGLRLGEVSCLADGRAGRHGFFPVFMTLSRLMVQYARRQGLDQILAMVHPKHARFYERLLKFESIGDKRRYPTVRNHPAVPLCVDFSRIDAERPDGYDTFFSQQLSDDVLQPQPISAEQHNYFAPMVDYPAPSAGHAKAA